MKSNPTFSEETLLWKENISLIAGLDEVGRGAFAGPVVVGAVIFRKNISFEDTPLIEINDSKLLSTKKREKLAKLIRKEAEAYSLAIIDVERINAVGIAEATKEAFKKAIESLPITPEYCFFDAFPLLTYPLARQKAIVGGDRISFSIAAASIIAKVYRDNLMEEINETYGDYGFKTNKGYGTKFHREQIKKLGLSSYHRTSFNLEKYL